MNDRKLPFYKLYFYLKENKLTGSILHKIKSHVLINNTVMVIRGYVLLCRAKKKYPQAVQIFITSGGTGDIFLNGLFLETYCKLCRINDYILIGDVKALPEMAKLFHFKHIVPLSTKDTECIEMAHIFFTMKHIRVKNLFIWTYVLNVNRCRTRMLPCFNFIETYQFYIYNFRHAVPAIKPRFIAETKQLRKMIRSYGIIEGNTVIISPYAYSVQFLETDFWRALADSLKSWGYHVIFNLNPEFEQKIGTYPTICFTYAESVPLLETAGFFIGLRSGLCDIIAASKCQKIILYPEIPDPINYSYHRSDIGFSSLIKMGLCEDAVEICSPVILDSTSKKKIANALEEQKAYDKLLTEILFHFDKKRGQVYDFA